MSNSGEEAWGLYGPAGQGKTRLAAAALRGAPSLFGSKALYVPIDPGSAGMKSILAIDRENLVLYENFGTPGKPMDPYQELIKIVDNKEAEKKGCGTIILDTMTTAARDILQAIANSGKYSDKHISIQGTGLGKLNVPMQGDYMGAQICVMNVLRLFEQSDTNIIVIFHDGLYEPETTSSAPTVGGPATTGRSQLAPVAGWFDNLVRIDTRSATKEGKKVTQYMAYTEKRGPFLAKLRLPLPTNPIPEFELNPDPVNFWEKVAELYNG